MASSSWITTHPCNHAFALQESQRPWCSPKASQIFDLCDLRMNEASIAHNTPQDKILSAKINVTTFSCGRVKLKLSWWKRIFKLNYLLSTSSVRGKNQRGDQQKQQHQSSHGDNKISTLSYLDSLRDPQSNDAASVQSSFFYASLAIVLTKLENFSDTASTSWLSAYYGMFHIRYL